MAENKTEQIEFGITYLEYGQMFLLFGTNLPRVINKSKGSENIQATWLRGDYKEHKKSLRSFSNNLPLLIVIIEYPIILFL